MKKNTHPGPDGTHTKLAEAFSRPPRTCKAEFAYNLTQAVDGEAVSEMEIARKLGVGVSTVLRWKTGETVPTAATQLGVLELIRDLSRGAAPPQELQHSP